ncbi:dihydroorotase [Fusibacter ferrireducens]|uniref:Dihydroorotase n=1 Tax=Fusibacter ferrireducens TaxID=2785058 RepID=A0ABR9ZZB7_9FIRM|nr:dihydroorotase [Fusibacter ferrireducens]MBF4695801.1 dihydroorotase [Fusibacter ferrireducens]
MKILIKNGMVINPKTNLHDKRDILIEGGIISRIEACIHLEDDVEIMNASGLIVTPGFIDLHVHLREPGFEFKETIETGTLAAAKGGFTTVACMPNTKPALDSVETIANLIKRIEETAVISVLPIGAITENIQGEVLTDHEALIKAGAMAISDDGKTTMNDDFMRVAFENARKLDIPVITHSEDHVITSQYKEEVYPIEAEYKVVQRDVALCKEKNGILHVAHVSGSEALKAIKAAKQDGLNVTCEAAPHHFALNTSLIDGKDPYSKVNPPIRGVEEQRAVIEGIRSGLVDIIATDHAPHETASKETTYGNASYGISGIETAFQIAYTELVLKEKISLDQVVSMMTIKPAEIGRLKNVGSIEYGYKANLTLIDLEAESVIEPSTFLSKGKNTPFKGFKVKGEVIKTIYQGKTVYSKI